MQTTAAGLKAFHSGDMRQAVDLLHLAQQQGETGRDAMAALTLAARRLGEHSICLQAVEQVLKIEPRNWQAHLIKGEVLEKTGDRRGAVTFYNAAVSLAENSANISIDGQKDLAKASAFLRAIEREYLDFLRHKLELSGFAELNHPKLQHALEIATGKRTIYSQQPSRYYFPELPQRQFYERGEFAWLAGVEERTPRIVEEILASKNDLSAYEPYMKHNPRAPSLSLPHLQDNLDWAAMHILKDGAQQPVSQKFPETLQTLSLAPQPKLPGLSPTAVFSRLSPGTHITPHTGLTNVRLLVHLPLIIPQGCWLRVGNDVREWKLGEALVFDDSVEHEAKNGSTQERIVLIFDIWRPELSSLERDFVVAMFGALESFA